MAFSYTNIIYHGTIDAVKKHIRVSKITKCEIKQNLYAYMI